MDEMEAAPAPPEGARRFGKMPLTEIPTLSLKSPLILYLVISLERRKGNQVFNENKA